VSSSSSIVSSIIAGVIQAWVIDLVSGVVKSALFSS